MRRSRALFAVLPLLLVADGAAAASKHEQTRRSASRKRQESRKSGGHHDHHDGDDGSDFWGSCLSGCLSSGCELAGRATVAAIEEAATADPEPLPAAPGLEPEPAGPPPYLPLEPEVPPEPGSRELPPHLVPEGPGAAAADAGAEEEEVPPWMPDAAQFPADRFEDGEEPAESGETLPASGAGPAHRVPAVASADEVAVSGENALDPNGPAYYGVPVAEAPPPTPPEPGWNGRFDLRTTGAWIFADLPNASFDARASVGAKGPGPALQVWYTGLWERIDETWDHLPAGGARLAFAFGTETVRPELRLGGALLHLGPRENAYAFDAGLAFEFATGGEGAPWIDLSADVLLFEGFTATDLGGGVSFPGGPFYVRVGFRSLYLETFYVGPEIGLGLRL